jgi:hypothetical protein
VSGAPGDLRRWHGDGRTAALAEAKDRARVEWTTAIAKPGAGNANAFEVVNAAASSVILDVDGTNKRVGIDVESSASSATTARVICRTTSNVASPARTPFILSQPTGRVGVFNDTAPNSPLHVASIAMATVTKTGTCTLAASDSIDLADITSGTVMLTLPPTP